MKKRLTIIFLIKTALLIRGKVAIWKWRSGKRDIVENPTIMLSKKNSES